MERNPEQDPADLGGVGEPVDLDEAVASADEVTESMASLAGDVAGDVAEDEVVPVQPEPAVPVTEPELGGVGEPVDLEELVEVADEVAEQPEVTAPADQSEAAEPGGSAEQVVDQSEPAETSANGAPEPPATGEPGPLPVGTDLPDLTDDRDLQGAVEALLLVVDSPIEVEAIADALEEPVDRTLEVLNRIADRYTETGSGIDLRRTGGGWRFYTRDRFAPFVEKLLLDGQRAKLTRAALETLAVIAYRQPVTRSRVAAVRGVNVDGVIRTLLARGLVEETGTDQETGGFLYRTTELFLERLGLSSLEDLPPLAPLLPEVDAIDDI